jgi:hypothetical protein
VRADRPRFDRAREQEYDHPDDLTGLAAPVGAFLAAYNFATHLNALRWRAPFKAICDAWAHDPAAFEIDQHCLIPGPHR